MSGSHPATEPRVVALTRDATLIGLSDTGTPETPVVRAETPYEAAAEILAETPAAVVIDFQALPVAHLRLLEVARTSGAVLILTGALPAGLTTDLLSGAKLLSRAAIAPEIRRIVAAVPPPEAARVALMPKGSQDRETPATPQPSREQVVLTPEELSALLEDPS